ncbi:MAG: DegQ family serine endoprotease [Candidatus Tectomicrobia bacterium]|nr:DegQ family serine endoprotease [Candidatus Tectomicrobia bacterium]
MRQWQRWFVWRDSRLFFLLVVILIGWAFVSLESGAIRWWWPFEGSDLRVARAQSPSSQRSALGWTEVAKAAMPAVVNIASTKTVGRPEGRPTGPFFSDPFFQPFFGGQEVQPHRERSLGSGVIVTQDGYVLTNNHVVEGAEEIKVTLSDRREFRATVVGTDPKTDVAVLKLPGSSFPVLPLGDSDRVEVAEPVIAIGNPFGLNQTVTMGIVSAVGRANVGIADYEDFIQTDAAINPGNSGGGLINAQGELIGINTAILSESGGYAGIGFAVPVNMARVVMDQIIKNGHVRRGWLGVAVQEITPALARGLGLQKTQGALVADVSAGSPAAQAGIQQGDVVLKFGDKVVDDPGHFRNFVAETTPGTRVSLKVLRGGREQTVEATVNELPERAMGRKVSPKKLGSEQLGISVSDLTRDLARRLGLPPNAQGAVVTEVLPGGTGQEAGLQPGDLIQEVNRQLIRSARDFARAVWQGRGQDLVLLVNREGSTTYLVIERTG